MAKSKSELRAWLDGLASDASEQARLYDSSINKLYSCLSSLYVWWREAKQITNKPNWFAGSKSW